MSESLDGDHSRSLSLDISSTVPSSTTSSEPSSPCRTNSQSTSESAANDTAATTETSPASSSIMISSTSSLPSLPILNVKFAPLPEMAPRKRRSGVPLGMAARVQLIRRRNKQQYEASSSNSYANSGTMWTDEELVEQRRRQEAIALRHAHAQASMVAAAARQFELEDEEDEARHSEDDSGSCAYGRGGQGRRYRHAAKRSEDDHDSPDPFLVLGRIVKGAGKTLWKRMASKDLTVVRAKYRENEDEQERRRESAEENKRFSRSDAPLRPILATITSNVNEPHEEEGGVYEEEIGDDFPLNVGQTETIMEGRAMYPRSPTPEPPIPPTKVTSPLALTKVTKSLPLKSKSINGKS